MAEPNKRKERDEMTVSGGLSEHHQALHPIPRVDALGVAQPGFSVRHRWQFEEPIWGFAFPPGHNAVANIPEQARDVKEADELLAAIDQRLTVLEDDARKLMWRYGL
jgi:hypothetical protein